MDEKRQLHTWIEVNKAAIESNIRYLSKAAHHNGKQAMLMVKANAYGHGLLEIARLAEKLDITALGIATLEDAIVLRTAGIDLPLMLFTEPLPQTIKMLHELDVTVMVSSYEFLRSLLEQSKKHPIDFHIKINTGLNRHGFNLEELPDVITLIRKHGASPSGILTHYSSATFDPVRTEQEFKLFLQAKELFFASGFNPKYVHASNSAATIWLTESETNLVRLGLAAYGLQPSDDRPMPVTTALSWHTWLTSVRKLKTGDRIGYGGAWTANKDCIVGVIPVGYSDGLRRTPKHQHHVLGGGKRLPVLASIMMNHTFLDLTDAVDMKVGDEIVLIGKQGSETIGPEVIAKQLETINEEVVTSLQTSIPRFYL